MKRLPVLLVTLAVFVGSAFAHNGMQHVMGTITSMTDTTITVKATDGKTQTIAVVSATKYAKGGAIVTLKDIKVGDHIVVHATKKGDQLIAAEVKVSAMKMNGMPGDMSGMKMDGSNKTTQK